MTDSRITMLTEIVKEHPNEALPRYSLAMELANFGDLPSALKQFGKLLELHPDYAPGYFMAAQALAKSGKTDEARNYLQNGIAAATRTGNAHARGEMEAMLDELG